MNTETTALTDQMYELVHKTQISEFCTIEGANVFLVDETKQPSRSFKGRGAAYAAASAYIHNPKLLEKGLVTASAGNHAQGVCEAANYYCTSADIYLPANAAPEKVERIVEYGAAVHLIDGSVDDALEIAAKTATDQGKLFIHPFDDELVIAGQASLGYEISQHPVNYDTVFVPVGGGGLLAGICMALAKRSPQTKVFGVQLNGCDAFTQSVERSQIVELSHIDSTADGTAVKSAGALALALVLKSQVFEGMVRVNRKQLKSALENLDNSTGIVAETAGALSLAGLTVYLEENSMTSGNHLSIISGGCRDKARVAELMTS